MAGPMGAVLHGGLAHQTTIGLIAVEVFVIDCPIGREVLLREAARGVVIGGRAADCEKENRIAFQLVTGCARLSFR